MERPLLRLPQSSRQSRWTFPEVITLKDFAQLIGIPATDIQKKLMGLGVLASLNQRLDSNVTTRLAKSYKVPITIISAPKPAAVNGTVRRRCPNRALKSPLLRRSRARSRRGR